MLRIRQLYGRLIQAVAGSVGNGVSGPSGTRIFYGGTTEPDLNSSSWVTDGSEGSQSAASRGWVAVQRGSVWDVWTGTDATVSTVTLVYAYGGAGGGGYGGVFDFDAFAVCGLNPQELTCLDVGSTGSGYVLTNLQTLSYAGVGCTSIATSHAGTNLSNFYAEFTGYTGVFPLLPPSCTTVVGQGTVWNPSGWSSAMASLLASGGTFSLNFDSISALNTDIDSLISAIATNMTTSVGQLSVVGTNPNPSSAAYPNITTLITASWVITPTPLVYIPPGLNYDAQQESGVVSTFTNRGSLSSMNLNLVPSGAPSTTAVGGRNYIDYASGKYHKVASAASVRGQATQHTMFAVFKRNSGTGQGCIFDIGNHFATTLTGTIATSAVTIYRPSSSLVGSTYAADTASIITVTADNSSPRNLTAWQNTTSLGTTTVANAADSSDAGLALGATTSGSLLIAMNLGQYLLYNSVLSANELALLQAYLKQYWGL